MDFVVQHKGQVGVVTALVLYSAAKNKLTLGGIVAAVVTAAIHMLHPWGVFFNLLVAFFIAGTIGTKVRSIFPYFLNLHPPALVTASPPISSLHIQTVQLMTGIDQPHRKNHPHSVSIWRCRW
jgi:hypothetical protein